MVKYTLELKLHLKNGKWYSDEMSFEAREMEKRRRESSLLFWTRRKEYSQLPKEFEGGMNKCTRPSNETNSTPK